MYKLRTQIIFIKEISFRRNFGIEFSFGYFDVS